MFARTRLKVELAVKLDRVEKVVMIGFGITFVLIGLAGLWAIVG